MGQVYRTRGTKLGREVAIKILPESFAQDPERLARFQREAQLLAAVNHPHIAGIYGLEDAGGVRFLVLELVDGESIAARLARGALPVAEALSIARQIVDALEAAHDKGIIHRDLKPANIMLKRGQHPAVVDAGVPPQVRAIIQRCLAGDRKARIPDFAVVRFLLDEPPPAVASEAARPGAPHKATVLWVWQAAAVLGLLAALGIGAAWYRLRPIATVARFFVTPPEKTSFVINGRPGTSAAISPCGSKLASTARDAGGKTLLWIRSIDSLRAQSLPGPDDAPYPSWSPDTRTLGSYTAG